MATNLNVTELDFDQIKRNLKNFLKQQTQKVKNPHAKHLKVKNLMKLMK